MLGLAIWMIDRIVPTFVTLLLWGALFVGTSYFFGLFKKTSAVVKVINIALVFIGISQFIGAFSGASNPLNPFENIGKKQTAQVRFQVVKDEKELEDIIKTAQKPIMIDFSAKWCVSCKELEEVTFKDEKVVKLTKEFKLLRIDITKNSDFDKKMLKRFEVVGPPAVIFYKNQKELKDKKIVGYKPPEVFEATLKQILGY